METLQVSPLEGRMLRGYLIAKMQADNQLAAAWTALLATHGYASGTLESITGESTITVSGLEPLPP